MQAAKLPQEILTRAKTSCRLSWREMGLLATRSYSSKHLHPRGMRPESHGASQGRGQTARSSLPISRMCSPVCSKSAALPHPR